MNSEQTKRPSTFRGKETLSKLEDPTMNRKGFTFLTQNDSDIQNKPKTRLEEKENRAKVPKERVFQGSFPPGAIKKPIKRNQEENATPKESWKEKMKRKRVEASREMIKTQENRRIKRKPNILSVKGNSTKEMSIRGWEKMENDQRTERKAKKKEKQEDFWKTVEVLKKPESHLTN